MTTIKEMKITVKIDDYHLHIWEMNKQTTITDSDGRRHIGTVVKIERDPPTLVQIGDYVHSLSDTIACRVIHVDPWYLVVVDPEDALLFVRRGEAWTMEDWTDIIWPETEAPQ